MLITIVILSVFCVAFSGIARGVSNVIQFHYDTSAFQFNSTWDPELSWMNKWELASSGLPVTRDGKYVERFFGSSRWFVMFTDRWHLFEFLHRAFLIKAFLGAGYMIAQDGWWAFMVPVLYVIFATSFHLTYEFLYD